MTVSPRQNFIEVNIGGQKRKIKMAMEASMKLTDWLLSDPNGTLNPYRRLVKSIMVGIDRKENNLPVDFDESMLMDWIGDMEQKECDDMEAFVEEALGFIVATTNKKLEAIFEKKEDEK